MLLLLSLPIPITSTVGQSEANIWTPSSNQQAGLCDGHSYRLDRYLHDDKEMIYWVSGVVRVGDGWVIKKGFTGIWSSEGGRWMVENERIH